MAVKKRKRKSNKAEATPHKNTVSVRVENPYFAPEHPESNANPKIITVSVNPRESAVETLFARKFLGAAQKRAADRFRSLWEAAGGKSSSIDYTQDRVDGGRGDPVAGRLRAAQELKRCRYLLGQRGYELVQAVCAEGRALAEISPHKRDRLTMADNLRADLDDLATMWGIRTPARRASWDSSQSQGKLG